MKNQMQEVFLKFLGNKLKQLRIEHGFSKQSDLAETIDVSKNSISRWENGLSME